MSEGVGVPSDRADTTVSILLALAARCEAEEPSRELDIRIWLALFDKPIMVDGGGYGPKAHKPQYEQARKLWTDDWPHWGDRPSVESVGLELECPRYTTSLDAAVILVPEGFGWAIDALTSRFEALVSDRSGRFLISEDVERYGRSNVAALAVCAAALRARAHEATP